MSAEQLPVEAIRADFDTACVPGRALIVCAPTGSGKSTRLPLWLDARCERPVLVVEPRRVACRALATWLSSQRGEPVGESIGYSVRFEERRSARTRVLFVTPGVALRLLSRPELPFDAVLLDEFHERGWETDLVAAALRHRLRQGAPLRMVVTSATLDAQALSGALDDAPVLEAQGRSFPVTIRYQPEGAYAPSRELLPERVQRALERALREDQARGEVLVFLPGKGELGACASQLEGLARREGLTLVPVHASLPMRDLARAFAPREAGARRVFLATNVAQTSLTLPGVTCVIDAGLARAPVHRAGRVALSMGPIAQDAADQRAGRAGRVAPGVCVRLWDEAAPLSAHTAPEIERMALDDVVLRAALCGLPLEDEAQSAWVTPPPPFALAQALTRLRAVSALDASGALTARGRALGALPVSLDEAQLMADAPPALARELADLVALMQRGGRLLLSLDSAASGQRDRVIAARQALFAGCTHEVAEALTALRQGDATQHGLHEPTLREARQLAKSLRQLLDPSARGPHEEPPPARDDDALVQHLLARAPQLAFVLRERAAKAAARGRGPREGRAQPWGNGEVELWVDPYEPHALADQERVARQPPEAGLILGHVWVDASQGLGVRGYGQLVLPCTRQALADARVGELMYEEAVARRAGKGWQIDARVSRSLAGVALTQQREPLRGAPLREALARFILEGRILPEGRDALLDDLHLWGILAQWPPSLDTEHWRLRPMGPPPEPEAFLIAQLGTLGLSSAAELALIEADDLRPPLEAITGVPRFELDWLLGELPRVWVYQGAMYHCQINPRAQRAVMTPANQAARDRKEPPRERLPRLRGCRVVYEQGSRVVTLR